MKFRKKPIVIEAIQWDGSLGDNEAANKLCFCSSHAGADTDKAHIHTLEGRLYASPGDWIIQGVKGELYPCKPDVFEKTYDPVEETKPASSHFVRRAD